MGTFSRWFTVGVVALAGAGVATSAALSDVSVGPRGPLTVVVTAAGTARETDCSAEAYAGTFFDGATVTVTDHVHELIGTDVVAGPAKPSENGCMWSFAFGELPESETYTVELRREGTPPRVHSFTYTADQLDAKDRTVWISVVA